MTGPVRWRSTGPGGSTHEWARKPENANAVEIAWGDDAGRWVVHHGDCIDVMCGLPSESVDACVTDPPYGMAYVSAWRKRTNAVTVPVAGDDVFDPDFHEAWARQALRVVKDGGALYAFSSDHHLGEFRSIFKAAGWNVKRTLVWVKNAWTSGDLEGDYGHQTEFIVYATKGRHILRGSREGNVLDFRRIPPGDLVHSCQKPVPLMAWLLRHSVDKGGVVIDPFHGSGATGEACVDEGMAFIGIESSRAHVETARRRLAAAARSPMLNFAEAP